jgi:hypothetical protein
VSLGGVRQNGESNAAAGCNISSHSNTRPRQIHTRARSRCSGNSRSRQGQDCNGSNNAGIVSVIIGKGTSSIELHSER